MSPLEKLRTITLFVLFLKFRSRTKVPDARLARLLNEAQSEVQERFEFNDDVVRDIYNGTNLNFSINELDRILHAVELAVRRIDPRIVVSNGPPDFIERDYSHRLPGLLRQRIGHPLEGDQLGVMAEALTGVWSFFYCSPIDRSGGFVPEVRGTAAIFHAVESNSTSMDITLLSKHSRWKGQAFVNNTHLYIVITDVNKIETAFFLTNKPVTKRDTMIVGAGAALERVDRNHQIRPVAGILCFGEKWDGKSLPNPNAMSDSEPRIEMNDLRAIVDRAVHSFELGETDIATLRSAFCVSYPLDILKKDRATLYDHVQTAVAINGSEKLSLVPWPGLYISWR